MIEMCTIIVIIIMARVLTLCTIYGCLINFLTLCTIQLRRVYSISLLYATYMAASLEGSTQFPYSITAVCLLMKDSSSSVTLVKVHDLTAPSDGDTAGMEVRAYSGRVGAGTSNARLEESFTGVGECPYNTSTEQTVAYSILVLAAPISRIIGFIHDASIDGSKDLKIFPHTRRELCSESNEVERGETNPEIVATEIGDVRITVIHCAERRERLRPLHRYKFDRSKVIEWQQHNYGNKLHRRVKQVYFIGKQYRTILDTTW